MLKLIPSEIGLDAVFAGLATDSLLSYVAIGALAGLCAGLFGIGGGVVMVPALRVVLLAHGFPESTLMHVAIATSLATIIPTSVISTFSHALRGAVCWECVHKLASGLVVGCAAGALAAAAAPGDGLRITFALFLFIVGVRMGLARPVACGVSGDQRRWRWPLWGVLIGALSTVFGIGGGTMTVPLLARYGLTMHQAVATSSACGFVIGSVGAIVLAWSGLHVSDRPPDSWGFIYAPAYLPLALAAVACAPLGVRLAHSLPTTTLKRLFGGVMVVVAIRLVG